MYPHLERMEMGVEPGNGISGEARWTKDDVQDWYALFTSYDRHGRGSISMEALRRRLDRTDLSPREKERLLLKADRNKDSVIDFEEFCYMMAEAKDQKALGSLFRAGQMVVPKSQRKEKFRYLQQYHCCPPPFFMILISIVEIVLYVYYLVDDPCHGGVSISGPVPTYSPLIYDPYRRYQAWRYLSYMFIHIGIYHIVFNVLTQVVLGIPLEMVHQWWRVGTVYLLGVIAGSLAVSMCDPKVFLAGASGGVYALLAAHVANLVVNWSEMEFAWIRLIIVVVLVGSDFGVAIYNRVRGINSEGNVSFVAHIGGFVAGLLLGIVVLRNFRKRAWERVIWWMALISFGCLLLLAILWNIFYPQYYKAVHDPFYYQRSTAGCSYT